MQLVFSSFLHHIKQDVRNDSMHAAKQSIVFDYIWNKARF